ncbi:chromatin associated protein KTI12 [Myxozyma melibiosi]|uniref:Chromatin associated protein KTI12 n=1 Tax=Myxozyma melibiosi TaxID=54550 RepID=A0ABR1FD59_9ASCO
MPIVLLSGFPCSGKTTRAKEIVAEFETRAPGRKVHLVSDDGLDIKKDSFRDAKQEKQARANLMSAIKRHLSREDVLVVDSLNYIKGFRYQIFCEAKAEQSTYAVVHVGTPPELCREWNEKRREQGDDSWESDLFDALIFRYEEPNGMNRWDSPLFTLPYTDPTSSIFPALYESLIHGKTKPPNFATILKPAAAVDYVYELDRQTQEVAKIILERQQDGALGTEVAVDGAGDAVVSLPIESVSSAQLQRLRRSFVALNKVRQIDAGRIKGAFAEYLDRNFS